MVVDDLLAQALLLQQALQVQAVLGERRVDRLVVGQEERDALRLVRQDVCAAKKSHQHPVSEYSASANLASLCTWRPAHLMCCTTVTHTP